MLRSFFIFIAFTVIFSFSAIAITGSIYAPGTYDPQHESRLRVIRKAGADPKGIDQRPDVPLMRQITKLVGPGSRKERTQELNTLVNARIDTPYSETNAPALRTAIAQGITGPNDPLARKIALIRAAQYSSHCFTWLINDGLLTERTPTELIEPLVKSTYRGDYRIVFRMHRLGHLRLSPDMSEGEKSSSISTLETIAATDSLSIFSREPLDKDQESSGPDSLLSLLLDSHFDQTMRHRVAVAIYNSIAQHTDEEWPLVLTESPQVAVAIYNSLAIYTNGNWTLAHALVKGMSYVQILKLVKALKQIDSSNTGLRKFHLDNIVALQPWTWGPNGGQTPEAIVSYFQRMAGMTFYTGKLKHNSMLLKHYSMLYHPLFIDFARHHDFITSEEFAEMERVSRNPELQRADLTPLEKYMQSLLSFFEAYLPPTEVLDCTILRNELESFVSEEHLKSSQELQQRASDAKSFLDEWDQPPLMNDETYRLMGNFSHLPSLTRIKIMKELMLWNGSFCWEKRCKPSQFHKVLMATKGISKEWEQVEADDLFRIIELSKVEAAKFIDLSDLKGLQDLKKRMEDAGKLQRRRNIQKVKAIVYREKQLTTHRAYTFQGLNGRGPVNPRLNSTPHPTTRKLLKQRRRECRRDLFGVHSTGGNIIQMVVY